MSILGSEELARAYFAAHPKTYVLTNLSHGILIFRDEEKVRAHFSEPLESCTQVSGEELRVNSHCIILGPSFDLEKYWELVATREVKINLDDSTGSYDLVQQLYPGKGYIVYNACGVQHYSTFTKLLEKFKKDREALEYCSYEECHDLEQDSECILDIESVEPLNNVRWYRNLTLYGPFTEEEKGHFKALCLGRSH